MKVSKAYFFLFTWVIYFVCPYHSYAQVVGSHQQRIQLDTAKKRNIRVDVYRGIVAIKATKTEDSILTLYSALINYDQYEASSSSKDSLEKFLTDRNPKLSITQSDGNISISNSTVRDIIYLEVSVPADISVQVSTTHFGDICVKNISGNVDVKNFSGQIILEDLAGSISAQTVRDGSITAIFNEFSPTKPAVMTTYDGDITLMLPDESDINLKMQSELGEIQNDFLMESEKYSAENVIIKDNGQKRQKSTFWIESSSGKGGPLFLLQTIRKNIYIKKNK